MRLRFSPQPQGAIAPPPPTEANKEFGRIWQNFLTILSLWPSSQLIPLALQQRLYA
ncbi:MAG: hypothetical protein MJA27_19450 [Pseudanabaenales cyanobacterium]|nr:hypothetical protein [Pseudanabaenales cyanobacterium]